MSLRTRVKAAVNKAFAAVDDLVVVATLSTKSVSSYDFATRGVVATTGTQQVEVIIISTQRPSGEGFSTTAIMKQGPDLSVYDTLTVGATIYNIVDYTDDEFTISASIVREK